MSFDQKRTKSFKNCDLIDHPSEMSENNCSSGIPGQDDRILSTISAAGTKSIYQPPTESSIIARRCLNQFCLTSRKL